MKHTHVIEAASAEEFKKHVADLYHAIHGHHGETRSTVDLKTAETKVYAESPTASTAPVEEKPKKAKKSKEEKEAAPAPTPAEPPAEASADDIFGDEQPKAPTMVPYTMDDCQKRLQTVVSKVGIVKAKELLAKFGISKLVELPKEKFTSFITECDALT